MYNPDTGNKTQDKQNKGPSRMDNPETLATLDTQDTGQRQTKQGAIKNVQSRDTGNIRYTRHRTKTNKTRGQESRIETQDKDKQNKGPQSRDTGNIRYTRHRTKTNKTRGHQECTIQRHWQH